MAEGEQGQVEVTEEPGSEVREPPDPGKGASGVSHTDGLETKDEKQRPLGRFGSLRESFKAVLPSALIQYRKKLQDGGDVELRKFSGAKTGNGHGNELLSPSSPGQSSEDRSPKATTPFRRSSKGWSSLRVTSKSERYSRSGSEENVSSEPQLSSEPASPDCEDTGKSPPHSPPKKGSFRLSSLRLKTPKKSSSLPLGNVEEATSEENKEEPKPREIPSPPLSVMQISNLIDKGVLEEAHLNLLSLRMELDGERAGGQVGEVELYRKEKDLHLLYSSLRDKVKSIVRDSSSLLSSSQDLLPDVLRIIEEEEGRGEGEPGSSEPETWRAMWRRSVQEGVQASIDSVHLDSKEENPSWLSMHLGLLGAAVLNNLQNVKNNLLPCYPPEGFCVFETYVDCYHQAVSEHLQKIMQQELEVKDCYALLHWISKGYPGEKVMGSPSLQPEMSTESIALPLEEDELDQIRRKYCKALKDELKSALKNLMKLEAEEMWQNGKEPEILNDFYHSEMQIDICKVINGYVTNSGEINKEVEKTVVNTCAEELKYFSQQFQSAFKQWRQSLANPSQYLITYINSFTDIKEHMETYKETSPAAVEELVKDTNTTIESFGQSLLEHLKGETELHFRKLMTKKWLSSSDDFQKIVERIEDLSQHCRRMKQPYLQSFVNYVHYHMTKAYVAQVLKNEYSCKNRKHEKAAEKMRGEWEELQKEFDNLGTTCDWLRPLGQHLCDIIGMKNKSDIKDRLELLVTDYPDVSRKHLSAILFFRGLTGGQERQAILQRLEELKHTAGTRGMRDRQFFSKINVPSIKCWPPLYYTCLPVR
ncbi:EX3L4 protein, partial [Atractosteus spatula]|nr:EX3L4 protein [Atractosteus spatula]